VRPPKVEDIMKKPVYFIDSSATVESALQEMDEKGTKKILVKDGQKPIGVLEKWMITKADHKRQINEMDLRPFEKVPVGTLVYDIENMLISYPAVYIYNPENPNEFEGVVTTYDLVRAY
jgi:CBS domain-containing protein